MTVDFDKTLNFAALLAFDQHLDGAVGQFQQLQHSGHGTDAIETSLIGVVVSRISLSKEQNLLLARHRSLKGFNGFFTPDE